MRIEEMLSNGEKTFGDMARYLQRLLPQKIPVGYSIKPVLSNIESEENIRNGVLALKDFMSIFYGLLIEDGNRYEKLRVRTNKTNRTPSLAVDFPFIYHVRSVLLNIGYHSVLRGDVLSFSGLNTLAIIICCEGMESTSKISVPKLMDCLRFLSECGMYFEGIESIGATNEGLVEVTYPDAPAMLTGLKVMSVAQRDLKWKTNDDIFLRCDYRALSNDKADIADILRDFVSPFSAEIQECILHMHLKCIEKGLGCTVKTGLKNSFTYSYKKNIVWELSSSFASGYRIFVKMPNNDMLELLTPLLQELTTNGCGCENKRFCKPCEKGCHGFYISLPG